MIEIKSRRTARNAHFELPNGNRVCQSYAGDVHYDNHDGIGDGELGWRKVDITPEIVPQGWEIKYAPYAVTVPLLSTIALQFRDKRRDGAVRKNMLYTISAPDATEVLGALEGNEVVYRNALGEGAHLVYKMLRHGVAKVVRVEPSSPVATSFRFHLDLPPSWKVVRQGDGSQYELLPTGKKTLDTGKKTVFVGDAGETYAAPFRWSAGPEEGGVLSVTAEHIGNGVWEVVKSIPAEWTRQAPLEMDVTATSTVSSDGYVGHVGAGTYALCVNGNGTGVTMSGANLYMSNKPAATTHCYRPVIVFGNTVPADATIVEGANTHIKVKTKVFSATRGVRVVSLVPANYAAIAATDFRSAGATPPMGSTGISADGSYAANNTEYTHVLNATGVAAINKNAYTGYGLRQADAGIDALGTTYAGAQTAIELKPSEDGGAGIPVESIEYTPAAVPSAGNQFLMMGVG